MKKGLLSADVNDVSCVPHLLHCPSVLAARAVLNEIASAWPPTVRRSIAAWKRLIMTQLFWAQVAKWLWFMIKWNVLKWTQNHPNWSNLRRSFMASEPMVLGQKWIQIVVFLVSFAYRLTTSCLLAAGFPNQGNLPAAKKRLMPSTANSSTPDSVVAPLPGRSIEHFSHIKPCKGLRLAKKTSRNDGNPVLQTEN